MKVFNEKTVAALKCHSGIDQIAVRGTTIFIDKMLSFWKIVSNKEIKGEERHRDPLKKRIPNAKDKNLNILREMSQMAEKMQGRQGCRVKSLTRDTSLGIQQTCNGLIELSKCLLDDSQEYVLLGIDRPGQGF